MVWPANVTATVEIGLTKGPLEAVSVWTDITTDVREIATTRGRQSINTEFDVGTLTVLLDNRLAVYDPNNSSSTHDPNLKLGVPIRVQMVHNSITYNLFYGHIDDWALDYATQPDATVTLGCVDNMGLLRTGQLTNVTYSQESSDTRLGNILDDIGWPGGARSLDSGVSLVAAVTAYTGPASTLITQLLKAEVGHLYIAGDGDATFKNRVAFSALTSQATYDPGTSLDYEQITLVYDKDTLYNEATVTGQTGSAQTATDATSATDHGPHAFPTGNDGGILGAPEALNVAEWIVGIHKDVAVRIVGFEVHPEKDQANLYVEVLGRELLELVTVKYDPPGAGTTLDQIVAVQSVTHTVIAGSWVTNYTCYPLSTFETVDYWVLDTANDLDVDTILA